MLPLYWLLANRRSSADGARKIVGALNANAKRENQQKRHRNDCMQRASKRNRNRTRVSHARHHCYQAAHDDGHARRAHAQDLQPEHGHHILQCEELHPGRVREAWRSQTHIDYINTYVWLWLHP